MVEIRTLRDCIRVSNRYGVPGSRYFRPREGLRRQPESSWRHSKLNGEANPIKQADDY